MDSLIMLRFQQDEIDVSEFIKSVHFPDSQIAVLDGIEYGDAVEFAEQLVGQGERAKHLLSALLEMKDAQDK